MKTARKANEIELKKLQMRKIRRKNRMKRRLIVFVFLFLCTAIIFTVLKAPFFNIKEIVCVGQESLTKEEIIAAVGAKTGGNIFSVNISAMKRDIAAVPAVAESNVRRLFPNKIKIWVREAKESGFVESGGKILVIDKNGKIIKESVSEEEKSRLSQIVGINTVSETAGENIAASDDMKAKKVFECLELIEKLGMSDSVKMVDASDLSDLKLDYENRLSIYIGSYENMEYKLTFIKKVIDDNISEYEHADLDFRGDKLYVGPKEEDKAEETEEKDVQNDSSKETAEAEDTEEKEKKAENAENVE